MYGIRGFPSPPPPNNGQDRRGDCGHSLLQFSNFSVLVGYVQMATLKALLHPEKIIGSFPGATKTTLDFFILFFILWCSYVFNF